MQMLSLYKLCDRLTNLGGGTFLPGLTNHCPVVTSLLSSLIAILDAFSPSSHLPCRVATKVIP